jgi:hypothetical protein
MNWSLYFSHSSLRIFFEIDSIAFSLELNTPNTTSITVSSEVAACHCEGQYAKIIFNPTLIGCSLKQLLSVVHYSESKLASRSQPHHRPDVAIVIQPDVTATVAFFSADGCFPHHFLVRHLTFIFSHNSRVTFFAYCFQVDLLSLEVNWNSLAPNVLLE